MDTRDRRRGGEADDSPTRLEGERKAALAPSSGDGPSARPCAGCSCGHWWRCHLPGTGDLERTTETPGLKTRRPQGLKCDSNLKMKMLEHLFLWEKTSSSWKMHQDNILSSLVSGPHKLEFYRETCSECMPPLWQVSSLSNYCF